VGLGAELFHSVVNRIPVVGELAELFTALGSEFVIFAGRTSVGFLPLVIEELFAAHFAKERVERAFLGGELSIAQLAYDVGNVDFVGCDDLQQKELEQTFAQRGEFIVETHEG